MRILAITAGAANMYCGSCLRDNALAAELIRQGHDVTLLPIYTPTRTDEPNVSANRVLYGGVNVYLQQRFPLFRRTPAFVDRLFDSGLVMRLVSRLSVSTDPAELGDLTVSTLRGEDGYQKKEVAHLVSWLTGQPRPDLLVLPNSLMIGLAKPLARSLGVPIACTLQGEDLFLDGLSPSHRREAVALIRQQVKWVDAFLPVSEYYSDFMQSLLGIPAEKMAVVPLGITLDGYRERAVPSESAGRPIRVGYLARVAPEKGLHNLVEAYCRLRRRPGARPMELRAAGYLGREHEGYLEGCVAKLGEAGLESEFRYHGVLDRAQKIAFFESLDIASVPTDYEEPKGLFLLEAMAAGVPVVQPRRGAFAEMIDKTGGGTLVPAGDPDALADALAALASDDRARSRLGERAAAGVRAHYSAEAMARRAAAVFEALVQGGSVGEPRAIAVGED